MVSRIRSAFEPVLRKAFHLYWRQSRGLTLGVRAVVQDHTGRVFLIKHSYVSGWHLPGGGVEPGETILEALARELKEEGNIDMIGRPRLHGIYYNGNVSNRDHVVLFVVREYRQEAPPKPDHEIIAHGFFSPRELPEEATQATRTRISEVLAGAPPPQRW